MILLAVYFAVDGRIPRDPGLYWADLPRVWRALGGGRWEMVGPVLLRPGGWLVVLMATVGRISRDVWLMELLSVVSVATVVDCAGRLGATVGRQQDAAAAVWGGWLGAVLAAGMPLVVVQGRLPWIHLPEAALLGVLMVVLTEDPKLSRWTSWGVAAVAGLLLASVRHSGLVWLLTVVPLLRGRAWWLLLPWGVGALPSVGAMLPYLLAKTAARESYASRLPSLMVQSGRMLGVWTVAVVSVGLGLRLRHRRWDRLAWVAGAQLLTAGLLWMVFRAGIDNFTPMALGLVILAAGGTGRWTTGLATAGALWVWTLSFVPVGAPDFRTLHTRWRAPEVRAIRQLLKASCVEGPCRVGADSGLFMPDGEEPGRLELWLLGLDKVELIDLRAGPRVLAQTPVEAVAHWDCGERDAVWLERFPRSLKWQRLGRNQWRLAPAWVFRPDDQCALVWWTPDGRLPGTPPRLGRPPERHGE